MQMESAGSMSSVPLSLVKDKVHYRRKIVYELCLNGQKQQQIAKRIGCSVSTIEKDFRALRDKRSIKSEGLDGVCEKN
jgi:transposase